MGKAVDPSHVSCSAVNWVDFFGFGKESVELPLGKPNKTLTVSLCSRPPVDALVLVGHVYLNSVVVSRFSSYVGQVVRRCATLV